jgi:hypothetical protein
MKNSKKWALLALLLPAIALFFGLKAFSPSEDTPLGPPPSNAVGVVENGVGTPLYNKLVKKFQDGGDITSFHFVELNDGWNMVRRGTKAGGGYRSETFRVNFQAPWILYTPVWFTVCDHMTCWTCHANAAKNACLCAEGGGCNFGITPPEGIEVVVLGY